MLAWCCGEGGRGKGTESSMMVGETTADERGDRAGVEGCTRAGTRQCQSIVRVCRCGAHRAHALFGVSPVEANAAGPSSCAAAD